MNGDDEQEQSTSSDNVMSERDALVQAANAADAGEDAAEEKAPKPELAKTKAPEEPPVDRMASVSSVLKAREKAQAARDDAEKQKSEMASMRAELDKELAAVKAERAKYEKLRASPMEAIKEIGWSREQLVDEVTREGDPAWIAQKRQEAKHAELDKELAELKAWREEQKTTAAQREEQELMARVQATEQQFLSLVPEDSALRALYDDAYIVEQGHRVSRLYREKTGGKVASLEEVRDYLEDQAAQRLETVRGKQSAQKDVAGKPKASGPRTLSASSASERRASPKSIRDMSPEEETEALKAAAGEALRSFG